MPKACHQVVQIIKALYGISMGNIMYYLARHEIHAQAAFGCKYMQGVLHTHGIPLDPHAAKDCYGWQCKNCMHEHSCKIGRYKGVWEIPEHMWRTYGTIATAVKIVELQKMNGQSP